MDDKKLKQIQKLLDAAEGNLSSARNLMSEITGVKQKAGAGPKDKAKDLSILDDGKTIEGIFDGEQMVAPDGKKYPVPANYASKSKLVEGDVLKLTIGDDGGLTYKQIDPVERKNLIGTLKYENGNYSVLAEGKDYKVLFASVTYYKGKPGNKTSIVVPAKGESAWAAVESIIHDHGEQGEASDEEQSKNDAKDKGEEEPPTIEIPEENKEILEEVKESYEKDSVQKGTKDDKAEKENNASVESETTVKPLKKLQQNSSEEDSVKNSTEKEESTQPDVPKIQNQGDYMKGSEDSVAKEESDENSLGEKTEKTGQDIQELEI